MLFRSRQQRAIASREHIDLMAGAVKLPRNVGDVDVLTAAVDAARDSERGRMFTDECDFHEESFVGRDRRGAGQTRLIRASAQRVFSVEHVVCPSFLRDRSKLQKRCNGARRFCVLYLTIGSRMALLQGLCN